MTTFDQSYSQPVSLTASTEGQTYGLFALAMALTVVGVYLGMQFAQTLFTSGIIWAFVIAELVIIFTSTLWMNKSPLNVLLFGAFPVLSGITITPYLMLVLQGYANGGTILLNALLATTFMGLGAAVLSRTSHNLGVFARGFLYALIGIVLLGVLQIFVPALRTTQMELLLSGAGILVFAFFTAYDLQRISAMGKAGANPFQLALSLYLDIFNLFLSIVRFMIAISGDRR